MGTEKIIIENTVKAHYPTLVNQLTLLANEHNACQDIFDNINKITDSASFKKAYKDTMIGIAESFGVKFPDEDDIDELKDEVEGLKTDVSNFESELEELKERFGVDEYSAEAQTVYGDYKLEHFFKYKDNYTWYEFEELLKNGKQFLNK